ncbi:short-chain dehydrogenase/reductase 2 [Purpureocillium lavendulum]|uniref:Short-chain dehydrogenase/reductase 2 n=1 Tax=Purpureocillium lavendulum TaxID=1247861 RepID=A0AB34FTN2_9HYPO|nr:short-chain dehydrogenase/reductase 2 [Purpureocillium lavendulum]
MAVTIEEEYSNPLPKVRRLITTSNAKGQSIFAPDLAEEMEFWRLETPENAPVGFFLGYLTDSSPAPLKDHEDLRRYKEAFAKSERSGLVSHGGTILRYVDVPPQDKSTMHRTTGDMSGGVDSGLLKAEHDKGETEVLETVQQGGIKPQHRPLHDPSVTFEEYHHYANETRSEEDKQVLAPSVFNMVGLLFPSKSSPGPGGHGESTIHVGGDLRGRAHVTDDEWANASRALRTASRGAVFYLITTDVLGPFGIPYAVATMGWGPGIALYTVFAVMAGYSGYLLWDMFMGLDSHQFPVKTFGDLGYRLYGPWLRFLLNILQGIQLIFNVGMLLLINGEALSQVAQFKLCFIVCCAVWAITGFTVGQIRTLQKFGWLANFAVWLNLLCMFMTMGGAARYQPNYSAARQAAGSNIGDGSSVQATDGVYPSVQTSGSIPDNANFVGSINGAMQAVFAFGGAMIFPEFMAEMRRPKDFLTAMWTAQAFIYGCYMLYGLFMYGFQGQYVVNPAYLGVSQYGIQTAGNVLAMVSTIIAAALYGNIGVKVLYNNVFVELLKAPPLTSTAGKYVWVVATPVYWGIAFLIAAGIPNFSGLIGVAAAVITVPFTYCFPPLLHVAYSLQKNAGLQGEGFVASSGQTVHHYHGYKRLVRGMFGRLWYVNIFNIVYALGALTLAGLGAYSSIKVLMGAFAVGASNSFTCHSPVE